MGVIVVVHVLAGAVGLAAGYAALFAPKGGALHRRSGMLFVLAMLVMAVGGIVLSAGHSWQVVNIPAGALTLYLVVTGLTTVLPPSSGSRGLALGALLVAFAVGATELVLGLEALASGGKRDGVPAFPFLLFGVIGLCAGVGDVRMIRAGGIQGAARIARHLWRMSLALLIAAMSLFLGQADEFPKALRIPGLLAVPVLVVLVTMLYWVWRVRVRRTFLARVRVSTSGGGAGAHAEPEVGVTP